MQPYRFKIKHIPGSSNIADLLSRFNIEIVCQATSKYKEADEYTQFAAVQAMPNTTTTPEVEGTPAEDEELSEV